MSSAVPAKHRCLGGGGSTGSVRKSGCNKLPGKQRHIIQPKWWAKSLAKTHNSKSPAYLLSLVVSQDLKTPRETFPSHLVHRLEWRHRPSTVHPTTRALLSWHNLQGLPPLCCGQPQNSLRDCTFHTEINAVAKLPCQGAISSQALMACSCQCWHPASPPLPSNTENESPSPSHLLWRKRKKGNRTTQPQGRPLLPAGAPPGANPPLGKARPGPVRLPSQRREVAHCELAPQGSQTKTDAAPLNPEDFSLLFFFGRAETLRTH